MWRIILFTSLVTANAIPVSAIASRCLALPDWLRMKSQQPIQPFCVNDYVDRKNSLYILYDVNPPEGFNLRRDVYIRLAVFMRHLQRKTGYENVRLVLPPWRRLYHWKSHHIEQENLPWSHFFDMESLRRYAPVVDFAEFEKEIVNCGLDAIPVHKVLQLKHFKDMFENGDFRDKWEFTTECKDSQRLLDVPYFKDYRVQLQDKNVQCVSYQGSASMLKEVIDRVWRPLKTDGLPKVLAFLNAETVLHEHWADREFWRARRSMRFARNLVDIAAHFRYTNFNSTDLSDRVQRPAMWEYESESNHGRAIGGQYICAHLRRGDFLHGRENAIPTLKSAALQIKYHAATSNVTTVFLATDATAFEIKNLKSYMPRMRIIRFSTENLYQKSLIKDGGIAIVDQLICSHAYFFVGTYESTFTYRIYEEREILGFPQSRTFNTLCKKSTMEDCAQNSVWPIVY